MKAAETREPTMKLWLLRARDRQEPPFHFAHVAVEMVIAAETEEEARRMAAADAGPYGDAWSKVVVEEDGKEVDKSLVTCEELTPKEPGIVARTLNG